LNCAFSILKLYFVKYYRKITINEEFSPLFNIFENVSKYKELEKQLTTFKYLLFALKDYKN